MKQQRRQTRMFVFFNSDRPVRDERDGQRALLSWRGRNEHQWLSMEGTCLIDPMKSPPKEDSLVLVASWRQALLNPSTLKSEGPRVRLLVHAEASALRFVAHCTVDVTCWQKLMVVYSHCGLPGPDGAKQRENPGCPSSFTRNRFFVYLCATAVGSVGRRCIRISCFTTFEARQIPPKKPILIY